MSGLQAGVEGSVGNFNPGATKAVAHLLLPIMVLQLSWPISNDGGSWTVNAGLVNQAAAFGARNAVLIKVNQAGTVTESVDTLTVGDKLGYRSNVSARSG